MQGKVYKLPDNKDAKCNTNVYDSLNDYRTFCVPLPIKYKLTKYKLTK